jgi:hypothetical protein
MTAGVRPAPLPPESRPIGQVVGEAIRLYGGRFWPCLALGVGPAATGILDAELPATARAAVVPTLGTMLWAASFVAACTIVVGRRPRRLLPPVAVAFASMLPFSAGRVLAFPGIDLVALAVFALVGLSVPVLVADDVGVTAALRRGYTLARADLVHVLGGLATFVLVIFLTGLVLVALLRGFGDQALAAASFLSLLVLSPLFLLGAALLYIDQVARSKVQA